MAKPLPWCAALLALALCAAAPAGAQPAAASAASLASGPAPDPATVRFRPPTAGPSAADPALEAHMMAITSELRCLVCQNQTIADSHADLAVDLRQQTRELLQRGQSDEQIRAYMTARYGDFILYRPPLMPSTLVLWLGPGLLLLAAVAALGVVIARRGKLADDRFEPDPVWEDDPMQANAPHHAPNARPGTSA